MKPVSLFLLLFLSVESIYSQTPDFRLYVYAKDCQGIGTCDGKGIMKIQGGIPPYQVTFQSSPITDSTGLVCEGVYSATATDSSLQSSQFTFIVGSPNATYINTKAGETPVDTLYENAIERCDVRYTEIDSVRITNHQWVGADSVKVTWAVYQQNNFTSVFDKTYAYPKVGLCRFILYIYCSGTSRASGDHMRGVDEIDIQDRTLSISYNNSKNNIASAFPNPFSDIIVVQSDEQGIVKITDINGKIIFVSTINSGKTTIDSSELLKGIYVVSIENGKNVKKALLVK
jgi:hypothetical protein